MNITPCRLFKLRDDLTHNEKVICLAAGIQSGETLWLDGNRPSRLGGYVGQFRQTYCHCLGVSPTGKTFANMPMRYFESLEGLAAE